MDIKQKLEFYKTADKSPEDKKPENITPSLKALNDHFNGRIVQPSAPYLEIERRQPLSSDVIPEILIKLLSKNEWINPIPLQEIIFFDLETTGLAGGAGTFAFLLGFGWIKDKEIIVKQYLLPDYGREYKLFDELNQLFARFRYLVSYNGKSYDYPLLRNRFLLNRQPFHMENLHHIDLLHISRRVWKDSFASCDLKTMEANLLGVEREGDIPGAYIPQAYFDYIRTGVIHDVIRIITHNYIDITSLAGLLIQHANIESQPDKLDDLSASLRMARLAFELDESDLLDQLSTKFSPGTRQLSQTKKWKSLLHKRRKNWKFAVELWQDLSASSGHQMFALEELAKYYEHVVNDFKNALDCTQRALSIIEMMEEIRNSDEIKFYKQAFNYRNCRLKQKLA